MLGPPPDEDPPDIPNELVVSNIVVAKALSICVGEKKSSNIGYHFVHNS